MGTIRKLLFALLLCSLLLAPAGFLGAAPSVDWDERLTDIGVALEPAVDCYSGCWRIIKAYYLDESESGGLHHNFIKLLDEHGNQVGGLPWNVFWPDGNVRILSKHAPDWADFPLYDCFDPKKERGAYTSFAGDDPAKSDWISGMGLVLCHHVSYGVIWQWQPGSIPCADCSPRGYLPVAIR
jgi:hypothetical protein